MPKTFLWQLYYNQYNQYTVLAITITPVNMKADEWMNENARILSAFENRLRAGFV